MKDNFRVYMTAELAVPSYPKLLQRRITFISWDIAKHARIF